MSDRKLLTAKQLEITDAEREALLRVRMKLEKGVYRHCITYRQVGDNRAERTDKPLFNMAVALERHECGQVGCIGGWMAVEMGLEDAEGYVGGQDGDGTCSAGLYKLFFPPDTKEWSALSVKQAMRAIDNYLSGSKYPWGIR